MDAGLLRAPLKQRRVPPAIFLVVVLCSGSSVIAQSTPYSALQEQKGWRALDAGQADVAATAFRDALATDPNNARLHFGVGAAAFLRRRDDEAKAALDRALALDAQYGEARELLGRVLYRSGDLDGAIEAFESLGDSERGRRVAETLARWRREADLHDRMHRTGGSGFIVAFEGPDEAALAERAVASLERAALRIGAVLAHYPSNPLSVVLYTSEQFRDITRSPAWAAASFDGTIRVPVRGALASPAELDRVLAHEYTHALVFDLAGPRVPAWLNEGLAAALEEAPPDDPPARTNPSALLPLGSLQKTFGNLSPADARRAYATSGFAVQRLLDEAGGLTLTQLLSDVGGGLEFEAAFQRRMQRTVAEFAATLLAP